MNFWQWIVEKKELLTEEQRSLGINNASLITKLEMVEQIYFIYVREEELRSKTERENKYKKIHERQSRTLEANRKICEIGICVHEECQKGNSDDLAD